WSARTAFTTSSSTVVPTAGLLTPASCGVAGIPGKAPLEEVFPSAGECPRGALSAARGWLHRHWNVNDRVDAQEDHRDQERARAQAGLAQGRPHQRARAPHAGALR